MSKIIRKGHIVETNEGFMTKSRMSFGTDSDATNAWIFPSLDVARVCADSMHSEYSWIKIVAIRPVTLTLDMEGNKS